MHWWWNEHSRGSKRWRQTDDVAKVALAKPAIADTADTADTPGRIRGTAQLSKRAQGFGEYPLSSSVMRTYEYTVATK
jgi:hypothetical protein